MKTYKITFEIEIEDGKTDWIWDAIEQNLEGEEKIISSHTEEVTQ